MAVVTVLGLVSASSAAAGTSGKATLRFVRLTPVTVQGTHFVPGETVRVTLRAGTAKRIRLTRTSALGGFKLSFGELREKDRCGTSMTLVAVGSRGDGAKYVLPPRECLVEGATGRSDS